MTVARTIYGSSSSITITLAGLVSDANLSTGRCGTAVDLTALSTFPNDVLLAGAIVLSSLTATTAGQVQIFTGGAFAGTTVYTGGLSSADAAFSSSARTDVMRLVTAIALTTSPIAPVVNETLNWGPYSLASIYGGVLPQQFNVFVVHNFSSQLSSAGNSVTYLPLNFAAS